MDYTKYLNNDPIFYWLEQIRWHLFVTLQFRKASFYGTSSLARQRRDSLIRDIFTRLKYELNMRTNDLIYLGLDEHSLIEEKMHVHIVVHIKKTHEHDPEGVRKRLLFLLDRKEIITPSQVKGSNPIDCLDKHCQLINEPEKVSNYITKMRNGRYLGNPYLTNKRKNFEQFLVGYLKNKERGTLFENLAKNPI